MFLDICPNLATPDAYIQRRPNVARVSGFTIIQKVVVAIRMLAYQDRLDEYLHIGQITILEVVGEFTMSIVVLYGLVYLRSTNA